MDQYDNCWRILVWVVSLLRCFRRKSIPEIYDYRDASGGNPFAISLLILSNSNTEVERLFGSMNIIKYKFRNKMLLPMFSAILTVKYGMKRHSKSCKNFELANALIKISGQWNLTTLNMLPNKECLHFQTIKFCWRCNSKRVWYVKHALAFFLGTHKRTWAFCGIFSFKI